MPPLLRQRLARFDQPHQFLPFAFAPSIHGHFRLASRAVQHSNAGNVTRTSSAKVFRRRFEAGGSAVRGKDRREQAGDPSASRPGPADQHHGGRGRCCRLGTGADEPYDKLKRALRAEIDAVAWSALDSTISPPFDTPETGKIAVEDINH
jgi:hypothetical protein